jgi:multidrug efflux pump subunit AcrA (membrane-fusion protein)
MRRVAATLVVALVLVGWGCASEPTEEPPLTGTLVPGPVHLLAPGPADRVISSSVFITFGADGCVSLPHAVDLVADATYGTAFVWTGGRDAAPLPVMWRRGFTGRRSGSEVQVVDPQGNVVAITGHAYLINGSYVVRNGSNVSAKDADFDWSGLPVPKAFYSCGLVTPQL